MRYLFTVLMMIVCAQFCWAQLNVDEKDSLEKIVIRSIDINKYKNDKDFNYDKVVVQEESLWDKFWRLFWQFIDDILATKSGRTTVNITLFLLAIALIGLFVWKITQMNRTSMFGRNATEQIVYTVTDDNIHTIHFESAIQQAIGQENYRLATRLLYLQTLKQLADKGLIQWQLNKTNTAYLAEMKTHPANDMFVQLTHHFDYVWYGETLLEKEQFLQIQLLFHQFKEKL